MIRRLLPCLLLAGIPLVPPDLKDGLKGAVAAALLLGLPRPRGIGRWADRFLLGFLAWCLASSVLVSDVPERSIPAFLGLCADVVLLYSVLGASGRELVLVPTVSGVLAASVGISQYYDVGPIRRSAVFGSRITSTFSNPNHLSSYLGLCMLVLLGLSISEGRIKFRIVSYVGFLVMYTAVLMAGTRGVLVGLGAGVALLLVALPRRVLGRWREWVGLMCSMAVLTFLYSAPTPLNRGSEVSRRMASSVEILRAPRARDAHILHRWLIWSVTMRMVREHPVAGTGYGTFPFEYAPAEERFLSQPGNAGRFSFPVRPPPALYAHNDYLQVLSETGIVGAALFLAFLSATFLRVVRSFRLLEPGEGPLRLGVAGGLVSVLVHGLVSYPLHMPATSALFWALLGWLAGSKAAPHPRSCQ